MTLAEELGLFLKMDRLREKAGCSEGCVIAFSPWDMDFEVKGKRERWVMVKHRIGDGQNHELKMMYATRSSIDIDGEKTWETRGGWVSDIIDWMAKQHEGNEDGL